MQLPNIAAIKRWPAVLLASAIAFAFIAVYTAGCGGGSTEVAPAEAGWTQVGATFVGRMACRDCHASIDDNYGTQNHGLDFHTAHPPRDLIAGSCAACHTTGFDEASGYSATNTNPALEGIGCEECHGPGSKHVAASTAEERRANITRIPPADITCIDCHAPAYKQMRTAQLPVDDASLSTKVPEKVTIHRPPLLTGQLLYNSGDKPGPHASITNTCVTCHMDYKTGLNGKMDHSDEMLHPDTDTSRVDCASCHTGRSEHLLQAGVEELLIELGGEVDGEPDEAAAGGLLGAFAATHSDVLPQNNTNNFPDNAYVKAYKAARYNYEYVLLDGSMGVHNPGLAKELIEEAIAMLAD